ncbi:MAG: hypothetical protein RIT24_923 [Planctomycetota bacterium]
MADSVLQLRSVFGVFAVDGMTLATAVPMAVAPLLRAIFPALAFLMGGLMHPRPAACCTVATPVRQGATPETQPGAAIDLASAIDGYLTARRWLDADALPPVDSPDAQAPAPNVTAVCVILRLDGRFVGVGEDARGDATMLRRAVGEAVAKALGDQTIRSVREAAGDRITARLSLEVEFAGPLSPLLGRTIADACMRLVPGRDGIAVRRGDRVLRAFPSRMSLTDTADRPAGVITSLLVDAGLPPKDLNEFATEERVSLARFQSLRVRGDAPSAAPSVIERGGRTVELNEIGRSTAVSLAARLASRLAAEVVDVPAGAGSSEKSAWLRGTFDPSHDRYDPPLASDREAATALLSLARASKSTALAPAIRDVARARAEALLRALHARPERTPFATAICAITATVSDDAALRGEATARVRELLAAERALGDTASIESVLWLAASDPSGTESIDAIRAALTRAENRQQELARAVIPLALLVESGAMPADLQSSIRAPLAKLVETLAPMQVGAEALALAGAPGGMPADLLGGIAPQAGMRLDVRSVALAPFAAFSIARIDGFSPMRRPALRFLAQHVADDPWVGGFRSPEALRGLIRDSLGANSCPPDRLALGLLFALSASENG